MLPLADVCSTQASALISLCRKCSVQRESKVRQANCPPPPDTIDTSEVGTLILYFEVCTYVMYNNVFGDGRGERECFFQKCRMMQKPAPCLLALDPGGRVVL